MHGMSVTMSQVYTCNNNAMPGAAYIYTLLTYIHNQAGLTIEINSVCPVVFLIHALKGLVYIQHTRSVAGSLLTLKVLPPFNDYYDEYGH